MNVAPTTGQRRDEGSASRVRPYTRSRRSLEAGTKVTHACFGGFWLGLLALTSCPVAGELDAGGFAPAHLDDREYGNAVGLAAVGAGFASTPSTRWGAFKSAP